VIDALEWVARNHEIHRIKVVNISLGHAVSIDFTDLWSRRSNAFAQGCGCHRGCNQGSLTATGAQATAASACRATRLHRFASARSINAGHAGSRRRSRRLRARRPDTFDLLAKPDLIAPGVNIVSLAARGLLFNAYPSFAWREERQPEYFTLRARAWRHPRWLVPRLLLQETGLSVRLEDLAAVHRRCR
jgi:hypothetical protein